MTIMLLSLFEDGAAAATGAGAGGTPPNENIVDLIDRQRCQQNDILVVRANAPAIFERTPALAAVQTRTINRDWQE
jgi:hypothetical protein